MEDSSCPSHHGVGDAQTPVLKKKHPEDLWHIWTFGNKFQKKSPGCILVKPPTVGPQDGCMYHSQLGTSNLCFLGVVQGSFSETHSSCEREGGV